MLYLLIIVLMCLVYFHVYVKYSKYGKLIEKIPGPTPLPILGNLLLFINKKPDDFWNFEQMQLKTYFPLGRIWICYTAIVFIQDPDDLKTFLSDKVNITKGYPYKFMQLLLSSGLVTSTGELWQKRRKMIEPAFHANIIKKYTEITSEQGKHLIESIKSEGDESVQNLIPICSDITLRIIIEAAMGVKFKIMGDKANEYKQAIDSISAFITQRIIQPYIQNWMLKFFSKGRNFLAHMKTASDFTDKIIEERREYHKQIKHQSFQNYVDDKDASDFNSRISVGGPKKRLAMLDLLLFAEKEGLIDHDGIKHEVHTFTVAGYDTTGMAMVYILMLLAENEEAQKLARAEANQILTASGGKITMVEIQQMVYIERCVKEALRLFPPVPNLLRTVTKNIQLKNVMVPAGSQILIPIFNIHRNPKYWPNPLKFDPNRFLPEEIHKRHNFIYLPFSHGPRNCIGKKFAIAEMKVLAAQILHNFYLEPVDYTKDLQFTFNIVLLPTIKPKIKFIKIKK